MIGGKPIVRDYAIDPIIKATCNGIDTLVSESNTKPIEPLSEDMAKALNALFDDTQKIIKSCRVKTMHKPRARKYYKPKFTL